MPRHRSAPPPVTDALLQQAWAHIHRPDWPATLHAALEHPLYRICLHGIARNLAQAQARTAARPPHPVPAAPPLPLPLPLFEESPDA